MVDFGELVGRKDAPVITDPVQLFDSLDRKTSHVSLRGAQREALGQLHARRSERDLILKMPTGTGKSTVGLLYLMSHMVESRQPGVYLCPNKQLVGQVLEEAARLGVRAHAYPTGQPHPHVDCMNAEAVIVCTYDKLFNAKSTFQRDDVNITPAAIVLDDAHAGIEEIRAQFTATCTHEKIKQELLKVLEGACAAYEPAHWEDIKRERRGVATLIPQWLWAALVAPVRIVLSAHEDDRDDDLMFKWPWLSQVLRWCRCVVAADGVEIVPDILPVRLVRPYEAAGHRVFMSATLADDAVLVRELDCSREAALTPVVPVADAGMGERMVLVPSLINKDLDREWLMSWVEKRKKRHQAQVVVLSASGKNAKEWAKHGALVVLKDDVSEAVAKLRKEEVSLVAFAQRYDGIDLPDAACRILVIDGMPTGQGIIDRYDSSRPGVHAGVRNRTVYRIEQGMGRAVRSNADYAVVILAGPELATFTAKLEVRELMSAEVRAQIELGRELARLASEEPPETAFDNLVSSCLKRDPDWRRYYDKQVRARVGPTRATEEVRVRIADAERRAGTAAHDGDPQKATQILRDLLNEAKPPLDSAVQGRILQSVAGYLHEVDPGEALQVQKAAFEANHDMLRPPAGVVIRPPDASQADTASIIIEWVKGFADPNGAIAEFQTIATGLSFSAPHRTFEEALKQLAKIIGAKGERPESDRAPDNMILWPDVSLVIEAKNEATYDVISKRDAGQLHHSVAWFAENYGRGGVPVMVVPATGPDQDVVLPAGTRLILPDDLARLVSAVEAFVAALVAKVTAGSLGVKDVRGLLTSHSLDPRGLIQRFTSAPKAFKARVK